MIKYKLFFPLLLFPLFFGCQKTEEVQIVKDFLAGINKRDIKKINSLLSDNIEYKTWVVKNGKLESMKDTNQIVNNKILSNYDFLNVKFSLLRIDLEDNIVKTRESVSSDIFRLMGKEKYYTKEYQIKKNKIIRISTKYSLEDIKHNQFYDEFQSWMMLNYPKEERDLFERYIMKDKSYIIGIKMLYEKYKNSPNIYDKSKKNG